MKILNVKARKLLIVVDMVNGFAKKGNMADPNIQHITPECERLVKEFLEKGYQVIYITDCHKENCSEFFKFPVHCVEGTDEAEMVDALKKYQDRIIEELSKIDRVHLNGDREKRLCGNVNFSFEGVEGEALLLQLDLKGIAASSGSACTSGSLDPSHVLLSIGLPHEIAHGSLRVSMSEYTTDEEIDEFLTVLPEIIAKLRSMSPLWEHILKGETFKIK